MSIPQIPAAHMIASLPPRQIDMQLLPYPLPVAPVVGDPLALCMAGFSSLLPSSSRLRATRRRRGQSKGGRTIRHAGRLVAYDGCVPFVGPGCIMAMDAR